MTEGKGPKDVSKVNLVNEVLCCSSLSLSLCVSLIDDPGTSTRELSLFGRASLSLSLFVHTYVCVCVCLCTCVQGYVCMYVHTYI